MDGLNGIPTYTEDTGKEKFEKGLINVWPRIYRTINSIFYFLITLTKGIISRGLKMIFNQQ
jgi:hypothetical protein